MLMNNTTNKVYVILFCVLVGVFWFSEEADAQSDAQGSSDHPLVSRYTGAFIDGYEEHRFNEFILPLGPATKNEVGHRVPSKKDVLEGKITRILYRGPEGRSTLEIFRNYQSAFPLP